MWLCQCLCGNKAVVLKTNLRSSGGQQSCGCARLKHGFTRGDRSHTTNALKKKFYETWYRIRSRCYYEHNASYKSYGGRGIIVEWKSFIEFQNDMYAPMLKHVKQYGINNTSIERINNNGNYCKSNCRWATASEQASNRRSNRLITFKGKTMSVTEWSKYLQVDRHLIFDRLYRHEDPQQILNKLISNN